MDNNIFQQESVELISVRPLDEGGTADDKADKAVKLASEELSRMIHVIETKMKEGIFDQKTNLREMLRFLKNVGGCKTKVDVEEFLDLSPIKEGVIGSIVIVLATLDSVCFDILGANHFFEHGHPYLFAFSIVLIMVSVLFGYIRFNFIGKEIYNLKKAVTIGLKPELLNLYPGYECQWVIWFWNSVLKFIKQFWKKLVLKIRTFFGQQGEDEITIKENIECETDEATEGTSLSDLTVAEEDDTPMIAKIQSLPNVVYIFILFFAPSIPIHILVILQTTVLDELVRNVDHWSTKEGVLEIYIRLAYLNLIKFEGAEMSLTEYFSESIPQLTLRTVPFAYSFIQHGFMAFFSGMELFEMVKELGLFVNSFFAPSISLVLGTLTKMGFYFQVYKQGDKFLIKIEGGDTKLGVKLFDTFFGKRQKLLCVFGHFLTTGPMVFLAVTSCCGSSGPFPLLILLLSFSVTFWRPSHIPLYNIYYTWACTLSTLNFSRTEFGFGATVSSLARKIVAFFFAIIFTFIFLHLDYNVISQQNTLNILNILGSTFLLYSAGSLLLFIDRWWLRNRMGNDNFNRYVLRVTENNV